MMVQSNQKGFNLVEAILGVAVFALLVTALVGAFLYGEESTSLAGYRNQAVFLAEEGLEALHNIRDNSFVTLVAGTYGLAISGNQWILSGTSDTLGSFTRQLVITAVDANRRNITSTVTWQQNPRLTGSVSLTSRLTNFWAITSGMGNWANPNTLAGSLALAGTEDGLKIAWKGNYAYIVRNGGTPDFAIVDVTNPASPSLTGSLSLAGNPTNVFVSGNYAYVTSSDNASELQIINISNPASPTLSGVYNASGNADGQAVYVVGTTAYLVRSGGAGNEFFIVNVTNPMLPTTVGSVATGQTLYDVYVSGTYAYITGASNQPELRVIDVSTPALPSIVGSLNLAGNFDGRCLTGFGSTVVLGRADSYLYTISITTPTAPSSLGSFNARGIVYDVSLGNSNNYVFIATAFATGELQVVNIFNLAAPTLVGLYNAAATLNGIVYESSVDRAFAVGTDNTELIVVQP